MTPKVTGEGDEEAADEVKKNVWMSDKSWEPEHFLTHSFDN